MADGALWVLGGLDPSAGAGVLRDVATARCVSPERAVHVVVTALTQQGDGRPAVAGPMNAEAMRFQLLRAPEPAAVKIGLVPAAVVGAIAEVLGELDVPCVLDPVLGASAGGSMAASHEALLPLVKGSMVTPNAREYDAMIGGADPQGWLELKGAVAVLRKGGHDGGEQVSDTLWTRDGARVFSRPRVPGADPRGTGCALATRNCLQPGRRSQRRRCRRQGRGVARQGPRERPRGRRAGAAPVEAVLCTICGRCCGPRSDAVLEFSSIQPNFRWPASRT